MAKKEKISKATKDWIKKSASSLREDVVRFNALPARKDDIVVNASTPWERPEVWKRIR